MKFIVKEYEEKVKALNEFVSDKAFVNVAAEISEDKVLTLEEKGLLLQMVSSKMINKGCHQLDYDVCPGSTEKVLAAMRADGYS